VAALSTRCTSTRWVGDEGSARLDEVKATEAEITLWTFQANTAAIAFYLKQGFVEVERTDGSHNDERLPDVRMMWRRGSG
jgi:ribosomal protein S18 acetylase RimI-like enzyme